MKIDTNPIHGYTYNQIPNYNFSFALLDKNNRVIFSPFMCKDYLQDLFWSQYTGKHAIIYGFSCKKGMISLKVDRFRLAIFGGEEKLRSKQKNTEKFLNAFEKVQKIDKSKVIETDSDYQLVIDFSKEWTKNGPQLSTFTTLIRLSGGYEGEDVKEYLDKLEEKRKKRGLIKPFYMAVDVTRFTTIYRRLLAFLAGKKIEDSWDDVKDVMMAHSRGIYGFSKYPVV